MNHSQKLFDQYEDALLAILMDELAEADGEELHALNEKLKEDPDAAVPVRLEQKCLQSIGKEFRRQKIQAVKRRSLRVFRMVSTVALIAMLLLGTALAVSPSFRIQTLNIIIDAFEDHSSIKVGPTAETTALPSRMDRVDLSAIQGQYEIIANEPSKNRTYINLQGRNGEIICILIDVLAENLTYNFDTENCTAEPIKVQGKDATLYKKTTEDGLEATILWIDTEKGYIVNIWSFSVPEKELMDLAENIRLL